MRMAGQGLAGLTGVRMNDYGAMSGTAIESAGKERIAGYQAQGMTHGYGLKALADVKAAQAQADAAIAQGQAAGQAAMVSGLFDGIGSLAGGAISKWGAPKSPVAPDAGDAMDGGGILPLTVGNEKPWGYYPGEY